MSVSKVIDSGSVTSLGGTIIDYVEFNSAVSITATTEATSITIVSSNAVVYDGSTIINITFGTSYSEPTVSNVTDLVFTLWDGSTDLGILGIHSWPSSASNQREPYYGSRRLTPSAGSHTYSVRAYKGAGTPNVTGGPGGIAGHLPGYIRITRESSQIGNAGIANIQGGFAPLDSTLLVPPEYLNYKMPTVVGVGTSATGTGDIVPGLPSYTINDILLVFVQSSNQTASISGYTKLGPGVGFGTAVTAGSMRLTTFWKRATGSESAPTVTDTGDHTIAQIMGVRGCVETGDPFLNIGTTRKTTASTTGTASAGATPIDNCLVVNAFAHALDSASAVFSSFTNADLSSVTEQIDVATTDGTGGGIGVSTGGKVTAGNFAATTVTETSTTDVSTTFIMLPKGIRTRQGFIDRQIFTTPGFADTWTKPTAAKMVVVQSIGGGASGSAGRNAATAAGGGGGGGGMWRTDTVDAGVLPSTATATAGPGGAATANTDGAASNAGTASTFIQGSISLGFAGGGVAAGASASGSGGLGGNGSGFGTSTAAGVASYGSQPSGGGTGGTTAGAGGAAHDFSGAAGAGGGTTQATSAGGIAQRGGGGGGGGRSNTTVGTGGAGAGGNFAGGSTAGANGTDSTSTSFGGGGGAAGTSAAGPGGTGGWPSGGGGGGGSQSGAQRGGAGADGVVTVITYC